MKDLNFELSLINSPYFDNLLREMNLILSQKKKLLKGVKNFSDFTKQLSFTEKGIYESILKREGELLKELIELKGWIIQDERSANNKDSGSDFDEYDSNQYLNLN